MHNMSRFEAMQTFVRVVEKGGISRAAESLDLAKSAVSKRLSDLENRLGTQLLIRTTRSLSLTDNGRGYYEHCLRILGDLEEVESELGSADADLRGHLKVAAPMSFGVLHIGPALTEFLDLNPHLHLDVEFNDRHVNLVEEGIDLAIRIARMKDSSLIARRLTTIRFVTCASPAYLNEHGVPHRPADLSRHVCLRYGNVPESSWTFEDRAGHVSRVKVPVRLVANNGDYLREAAIAGLGLVRQPTFIVYQAIARGQLVPLLGDYRGPEMSAYTVYPQIRHRSHRVRSLIDFLIARFAGIPYWDLGIPVAD